MLSSMAYSSATRSGLPCSGRRFASTTILPVLGLLAERRRDDVGRRHQPVDVLMVLVQHHAVEAERVGVGELVDVFVEQAFRLLAVPQLVGHRDPGGVVLLVEVGRQVRIGHEVPAEQLDGLRHDRVLLSVWRSSVVVSGQKRHELRQHVVRLFEMHGVAGAGNSCEFRAVAQFASRRPCRARPAPCGRLRPRPPRAGMMAR